MGLFDGAIKGLTESVLGGASKIISNFKADPTKVLEAETELEKLRIQSELESQKLGVQMEEIAAKQMESVNQTMRAEASSDKWAQWLWRPVIGFTFSLVLINNYVIMPYFGKYGLKPIDIPGDVWSAMLVILGAAAATRGWEKVKKAK